MELEHFSHEHPLVFYSDAPHKKDSIENFVCCCCEKPIVSSAYGCSHCNYFLHKKCGELSRVIVHLSHSQHPLTILHYPLLYKGYKCNLCKDSINGFGYQCWECHFDAHVFCVLREDEPPIENKIHDHPLMFGERVSFFTCDACGTKGEDLSYRCSTCQLWIHADCASSATTIQRRDHSKHPLRLATGIPHNYQRFRVDCYICHKRVHPSTWVYYCSSCRYFAHLKCAKSEEPTVISDTLSAQSLDPDVIYVPVPGLTDTMSQFSICSNLIYGEERQPCCNGHSSRLMINNDINRYKKIKKKERLCDVCVKPIISSSTFSNCSQCDFIAHTRCTYLRTQIIHPSHYPDHSLKLYDISRSHFSFTICNICGGFSNGRSFFKCETCDHFDIDTSCATICLPKKIKHEAHNHPLVLQTAPPKFCKACRKVIKRESMAYVCELSSCDFRLHTNCAMLPGTLEHDWDNHKMSLTYPPFDHPEDYICETCEEYMDPSNWLYHCSVCDHSFHTNCAHPHDIFSMVKFGGTFRCHVHVHNLTFLKHMQGYNFQCNHCDRYYNNIVSNEASLHCAKCNYNLCLQCALGEGAERIEN